jgi:aminoglycoside phosphotransferase (APT) family kinase protein
LPEPEELREALAAGAAAHFGRPVEVDGPLPLLGGSSRELWSFDVLVEAERHELVLRRDPPGVDDPARRAREAQALTAAARHGAPGPQLLWSDDRLGLVMTRLEGEAIPRRLLRDERYATARERLVDDVARAAAAIHAIPLDEVPALAAGAGLGAGPGEVAGRAHPAHPPSEVAGRAHPAHPPGEPARRADPAPPPAEAAIAGLEAELDRVGEPHPALELGLRWLRRHLPDPVAPAVVHGDFRLGNFLLDEAGLVGVLDWELVHTGDPAEDLGWLCVRSWRFGHDDRPAAGCGTREQLLAAYERAGGRAISLDDLRFWEVYGNVRWGVLCLLQAELGLQQGSLERAAIGRRACEPEWDLLAMVA